DCYHPLLLCLCVVDKIMTADVFIQPDVSPFILELHVEAPEEVTEGETADLTCKTTCSLTDPTFIWYKNGRPLTTKIIKNNQLHLQTVSSEDAGSYSCAVRGSQHLRSTAHSLRVRFRNHLSDCPYRVLN
uniref:Ig-like domain-containing protein n=1 Tax=Pygocentrus nattereri TaxID=42514 RepID=A0A3B4DAZ4_PYGNA